MAVPVVVEGLACGALTEHREGLYTVLRAECPKTEGILRLWAHGEGRSVYLGVPAPCGDRLLLSRRLSREARRAFPAVIDYVSDRPGQTELIQAPEAAPPAGDGGAPGPWRRQSDGTLLSADGRLAIPAALSPASPFFSRMLRVEGRCYLVFRL